MIDLYSGDPRIVLTSEGADFEYAGGQPVMDRGLENCIILSLFANKDWCGNIFLQDKEKIGSDFEEVCSKTITLGMLADVEVSAEKALKSTAFGGASAVARNPANNDLVVDLTLGSGGAFSLMRSRLLWTEQVKDPAYRRIT